MGATSGRFVWFDLMTSDVNAARAFYSDIVGWKTTRWSGGDYEMWTADETPIGGLMPMSPEAKKSGEAPHWLAYVAVDDVDASAARAKKLGGKVLVPGTDIPNTGRYAVLEDPQGASFAIYTTSNLGSAPRRQALGHFSWGELHTTDWQAAWRFYAELFAWKKTRSMNMGPELGEYFMFGMDEKESMGGMSNTARMTRSAPHWLHYVNVRSADDTAKRVAEKGGKVLVGPMDVPGGDRIAQCVDPQGTPFAIYSSGQGTKVQQPRTQK